MQYKIRTTIEHQCFGFVVVLTIFCVLGCNDLGVKKGTNPPIPPSVQEKLFKYLKDASSVEVVSISGATEVTGIISKQDEMATLLSYLQFQTTEDQRDRGEDTVYWLTFSLPNGREALVHVSKDGWKFTGRGQRREYSRELLQFLRKKVNGQKLGQKAG
jgi:hypothetical protein